MFPLCSRKEKSVIVCRQNDTSDIRRDGALRLAMPLPFAAGGLAAESSVPADATLSLSHPKPPKVPSLNRFLCTTARNSAL